ncbi:hypothetical protein FAIPA1_590011 [Frankia sp. AiPs1]
MVAGGVRASLRSVDVYAKQVADHRWQYMHQRGAGIGQIWTDTRAIAPFPDPDEPGPMTRLREHPCRHAADPGLNRGCDPG